MMMPGSPAQSRQGFVYPSAEFLDQETGHPRSRVDRGEDKERFEHEREIDTSTA